MDRAWPSHVLRDSRMRLLLPLLSLMLLLLLLLLLRWLLARRTP